MIAAANSYEAVVANLLDNQVDVGIFLSGQQSSQYWLMATRCCYQVTAGSYDDVSYDDFYLEYYSGKGFHINYSCLHVLCETHKLVQ
jgi:hypothetical protein